MSGSGDAATAGSSMWETPLPYLFGGLGTMFFLISTSLIYLGCSYWRYAAQLSRAEREWDVEAAGAQTTAPSGEEAAVKVAWKEKFAVIMPGDENPTCLATPRWFRGVGESESEGEERRSVESEVAEKVKESVETTSLGAD